MADHEQIIALTAELKTLQAKGCNKKTGKKKGKDGKRKKKRDKKGDKKMPAKWMLTPPKDGKSTTKTVNEKVFHWCLNHKHWVAYTTAQCKGIGMNMKNAYEGKDKQDDNKPKVQDRKVQFCKALNAIIDSDDEDEE